MLDFTLLIYGSHPFSWKIKRNNCVRLVFCPWSNLTRCEFVKEVEVEGAAQERATGRKGSKQLEEPGNLLEATSSGPGADWPPYMKALLSLLREFQIYSDSEVLFPLVKSINLLCLHGDALKLAVAKWPNFVEIALNKYIIPRLFYNLS